jgi:hypothetical protein
MLKNAADSLTFFTAAFKNMWATYLLLFRTCRRPRECINIPNLYRYFAAENMLVVTTAYSTSLHFNYSNLNKLIIINTYYTNFYFFVLNVSLFYYTITICVNEDDQRKEDKQTV